MRRISKTGLSFGMVAALGLAGSSAHAQNLELSELAAALALPVITGGQPPNPLVATQGDLILDNDEAITLLTITNGRSAPTTLKIEAISGDPGDSWGSTSMNCLLTGRETVTFLAVPAGDRALLYGECGELQLTGAVVKDGEMADNKMFDAPGANGILFVAAADVVLPGNLDPPAIGQDILFGDAVVVDLMQGQAYGFSAIPFQAGAGANDGDHVYRFDGIEYAQWPSSLATNFIAPDFPSTPVTPVVPERINAELILFTLDGSRLTPPTVAFTGLVWDDDEMGVNWSHGFDCFDIVSLGDITPNFTQPFLGSLSGHLTITPQPIGSTSANEAHDATFGNGDGTRRRPVHGWIVQNVLADQNLVLAEQPGPVTGGQPSFNQPLDRLVTGGPAAWGRPLSQNRFAIAPDIGDMPPVLNLQ